MHTLSRVFGTGIRLAFATAALWAAVALPALAESITQFEAEYRVTADSVLEVTERIVYDFGALERRGIFREVENKHPQPATAWYKNRSVRYTPVSVTRDGQPEPYRNEGGDALFLRIGDPDVFITGQHEYVIVYRIEGAVSSGELAELYWNTTGNGWDVPIENISVTVSAAAGVSLVDQAACYAGYSDSTAACEAITTGAAATVFAHDRLAPGEALTVAHALSLPTPPVVYESINWLPFILIGIVLCVVSLITSIWRWRQHHNPRNPIIAQYEPYEDFKPMFTGVLLDGRLDSQDITAGIIHLAEQGFISIKQTEDSFLGVFTTHDHEVTLKRPVSETTSDFERTLLELLFYRQAGVAELEKHSFFSLKSLLGSYDETTTVGKTVRLSDIKKNQSKLKYNYTVLQGLKKAVKNDLESKGFMERPFLFSRRTPRGFAAIEHLKGFKDFLSVTEAERYKFHNAPAKSPQQFMEYLPYAIALGVEDEWAKVFKDIAIEQPDWYTSNVAGAHFSATNFASELGAFSTALASSGSSSSGSSGGGSVGGGGGGGGGGSW